MAPATEYFSSKYTPVQRETVSVEEVDDGLVLIDTVTDEVHLLNGTAALIWEFCDGSHSIEDIAGEIQDVFEKDLPGISRDIHDLVASLKMKGLLE